MPGTDKIFILAGGLVGGGWGAKRGYDGSSATICINDGDTHNSPVEQVEAKYPMIIERYALREDSGGPGTWQGGLGTEKIVRAVSGFMFNAQVERVHCRPWGLFGGLPGAGNQVAVRCGDEPELRFPSGKVLARQLNPGDAYILRSGGGGGYGSPLERPIARVADDLREGYVSRRRAERSYGIVFDAAGAIDAAATERRRAALRDSGESLDDIDDAPVHEAGGELLSAAPGLFLHRCC